MALAIVQEPLKKCFAYKGDDAMYKVNRAMQSADS